MDEERPKVLSSEEVYDGRLIRVVCDTVREGGRTYVREVVGHPGGAAIVPVFEDETVALVIQYRHPTRSYVLELPAGRLDPGESSSIRPRANWRRRLASSPAGWNCS